MDSVEKTIKSKHIESSHQFRFVGSADGNDFVADYQVVFFYIDDFIKMNYK